MTTTRPVPGTIAVTARDIADGDPGTCNACPIALALARSVPIATRITVCEVDDEVSFDIDGVVWRADLPGEAVSFVEDFDAGHLVGPFTFDIVLQAVSVDGAVL